MSVSICPASRHITISSIRQLALGRSPPTRRTTMRARVSACLRPHDLSFASRSALISQQVLLVLRVFVTALLAAHTTLFSATASYAYSALSVWGNTLLLLAMLSLTLSSLLDLVTDEVPASHLTNPPALHRILPAFAIPLTQIATSTVVLSTMLHWIFATTRIPSTSAAMYATFSLHLLNPFLIILDIFLVARSDARIIYIPLCYAVSALYALFSFCMLRFRKHNFVSDISSRGRGGYIAAVALALLVPVAVYLLCLLPATVGRKCMTDREDDKSGKQYDEEAGTDISSEEMAEHKADVDVESGTSANTRGHSVENANFVHLDVAVPPRAAVVEIKTDDGQAACEITGDRSMRKSTDRHSKRTSWRSTGDRDKTAHSRTLSKRLSVQSLNERAVSLRGSMQSTSSFCSSVLSDSGSNTERKDSLMRRVGSGVFPRSPSASSTAWMEVGDVVVDLEMEYFRMPGSGASEGVRLPPRVASVRRTRLA